MSGGGGHRADLFVEVDPKLKAELDAAVRKLGGHPVYLTRRAVVERGIAWQLAVLRAKHNGGGRFV